MKKAAVNVLRFVVRLEFSEPISEALKLQLIELGNNDGVESREHQINGWEVSFSPLHETTQIVSLLKDALVKDGFELEICISPYLVASGLITADQAASMVQGVEV